MTSSYPTSLNTVVDLAKYDINGLFQVFEYQESDENLDTLISCLYDDISSNVADVVDKSININISGTNKELAKHYMELIQYRVKVKSIQYLSEQSEEFEVIEELINDKIEFINGWSNILKQHSHWKKLLKL